MNIEELKQEIGSRAESIIASDVGAHSSNKSYPCFITQHQKGNKARAVWYADKLSFYCHDCKELYDIVNHAQKHSQSDVMGYLRNIAGVSNKEYRSENKAPYNQFKEVVKKMEIFNKNFSNLPILDKTVNSLSEKAKAYLESRNISEATAKAFGLFGDENYLHLNYWGIGEGKYNLLKVKKRKLGDIKNGEHKYLGVTGGSEILFGSHLYREQRVLIVAEGEIDALSLHEGIAFAKADKKVLCVSVPSGTSHKWIEQCEPFIAQFEKVVICPDTDIAGIKFREKCFEALNNVFWIDLRQMLDKDQTDINNLLKTKGKKRVADVLQHIERPYHSCGLTASKIDNSTTNNELFFTGFYGLDRCCHFKYGELALLAGESNDGKTTISRQMMLFAVKQGIGVGCLFGEETNNKFQDLTIRQAYSGQQGVYDKTADYFGDDQYTPTQHIREKWNNEYGRAINLFQLGRVRGIDRIGNKLLEWISHCADIEGRKFFIIDNLMKVTADEDSDEYVAQGKFIEKLYRLAQKKNVFIMMIVHTKKITGLIDQNSISGTKKLYNTPDYVLFFQRLDRFKQTDQMDSAKARKIIAIRSKVDEMIPFTSYIWAHKVRDRNCQYQQDMHAMEYNPKSTCSTELLPCETTRSVHENGWSRVLGVDATPTYKM